ncbi:glycosyl hydrolase [Streptomyces sp. NPDC003656]
MSDELNFHLRGLKAVDAASAVAERRFWREDLRLLAEHHSADGSHSYVVAHDSSITWGMRGEPQLAAIKVTRNLSLKTFTLDSAYHANPPFAQNWLIERGCPPEQITQSSGNYMKAADDLTLQVEQLIRESGARYKVLDTQTWEFGGCETWTLVHDSGAGQAPIRLFLEEADSKTFTYTMREGAFADTGAARSWLDDRDGPLPEPPEYSDHNGAVVRARIARIALVRSADAAAIQKAIRDAPSTPPAGPVQRPVQGRLL